VETRTLKSGKLRYREKVYINRKPITSQWFIRKTDASQWKQREVSTRDKNTALGIPQTQNIKFEQLADKLMKSKSDRSINTLKSYQGVLTKYLIPRFGVFEIKNITYSEVEDFKYFLIEEDDLSKNRVNFILTILKMALTYAVELSHLYSNPINKLKLLKLEVRDISYWDGFECSQFLLHTKDDHYYHLYLIALNTGMRLGELIGLCWDAIDLKEARITIKRTMTREGLQETTKSKKPRSIPMNDLVKKTLLELKESQVSLQFVFTGIKRNHVSYEHFTYRIFNKTLEKLSIKKIRFHDLRTTFASNFCMNNGNIFTLSKILGHSSVEITQRKYAFLNDKFLKEEMNKFEISPNFSTVSAPQNVSSIKTLEKSVC
jgi:integrase